MQKIEYAPLDTDCLRFVLRLFSSNSISRWRLSVLILCMQDREQSEYCFEMLGWAKNTFQSRIRTFLDIPIWHCIEIRSPVVSPLLPTSSVCSSRRGTVFSWPDRVPRSGTLGQWRGQVTRLTRIAAKGPPKWMGIPPSPQIYPLSAIWPHQTTTAKLLMVSLDF